MQGDEHRRRLWPLLLQVEVLEAQDVAVQDFLTSDPFAVVTIGNQTIGRTKVVMRNLNPVWNEQFATPLLHNHAKLRVSLYDFDYSSSDDDLGYVEVNLASISLDDTENFVLPIMKNQSKLGKGFMHINIHLCTRQMPIGIQRIATPLSSMHMPTAWCCEVARHVFKYYHLEGTKFTGLHPNMCNALMCPEVATRELISDINSLVSYGGNGGRAGDTVPIYIAKPVSRLRLKMSCRNLNFRQDDSGASAELQKVQWILPYLPHEMSVIRLETKTGRALILNTPQRHGSWVVLRLIRCLNALQGYEDIDTTKCDGNIPFVWTRLDLRQVLNNGDMVSSAYRLGIGEIGGMKSAEKYESSIPGHRRRTSEIAQHALRIQSGRLSHTSARDENGCWRTCIKVEYDIERSGSTRENAIINVADITDVKYKSDARGAVAEIRVTIKDCNMSNISSFTGASASPRSLIGGITSLRSKYYLVVKPRASSCFVIELHEVSGKKILVPSANELPLRIGVADEEQTFLFARSPNIGSARPGMQSGAMKRSNFIRNFEDPLSEVIEHIDSGFDVFLVRGHLYSPIQDVENNDPIKKDRFDVQPDVICHTFVPYSKLLSERLESCGTSSSSDGIKNRETNLQLDDLPEFHVTPIDVDRNGQYSALLPPNASTVKCRFCTVNGKLKKTKHGGYYPEGEYLDGAKKALPWGRVISLRAKDGVFWADLIRVELYGENSDSPVAVSYIALEEFQSKSNRIVSLALISPAESLTDPMSELSGVGGINLNDALGHINVSISHVVHRSERGIEVSLSCVIVPHDPGYQTGWHAECLLSGSTENASCVVETFAVTPGPEGLYLAAYPEDFAWWQDFSKKGSSKSKYQGGNDDFECRVAARKGNEDRVLLTVEERKQMTSPHILISWDAVFSAVTLSPSLLSIQVHVHRFFGSLKHTNMYHEAAVDIFVLGCPAEELRHTIIERAGLSEARRAVVAAVSALKQISINKISNAEINFNNIYEHHVSETAIDACENVISLLTSELVHAIGLYNNCKASSHNVAGYINGALPPSLSGVTSNRQLQVNVDSETNKALLRQIMRLRLYLAVLIEKFDMPPSVLAIDKEMNMWSLQINTVHKQPDLEEAVLARLLNRLNISSIAALDGIKAVKLVMQAGDLTVDIKELVAAANDVHYASARIVAVSSFLKRRLRQVFLCSKLLLRSMLSLNPALWDIVLVAIARRFVEAFFREILNCLENNFYALGGLNLKEEVLARSRRRFSTDGIGIPEKNLAGVSSEEYDDIGVVNKKLIAVQLYELLSVFALNNSVFDLSIREALLTFVFEPNSSFSIYISDVLDVDTLVVKWSSVLVVEMKAWVDSVLQQQKKTMQNSIDPAGDLSVSELPWLPKQFEDGVIISFIPESTTSALYNYLEECKFNIKSMDATFIEFGEKLECVVKNAFAVSYIYLSAYYKSALRKCCYCWSLVDVRKHRPQRKEPVRDLIRTKRLSEYQKGEDTGSDDDKLAWLCSVGNDSFRAIVDNLNGDIVGKFFDVVEDNIVETRVGFSESDVESSFDRACMSFKDNLFLAAEAIVCLILRDTPALDDDIINKWISVQGSSGVFQCTANALKYHFQNLRRFLKPYVYGVLMVILCQKVTMFYGQFIRYLHAYVVSSQPIRAKFTSISLAQLRDDIEILVSMFDYGISLVFPMHLTSEECIKHRAKVAVETSRLLQLKVFFTYSPSSSEVMHVVDDLVTEAQSPHSAAIDISNMVEACLALHVNAKAGDKRTANVEQKPNGEASPQKPEKRRKSILSLFRSGSDEYEDSVTSAICDSRKHISGFVAVEMLRRLHDVNEAHDIKIDASLFGESYSDISFWRDKISTLASTSYDLATIAFMTHENKPLIMTENVVDIDNKISLVKSGTAVLVLHHVRALNLPNLGLRFRKAPLQLHCRLGDNEITSSKVRGGRTCEWADSMEFEVLDLSALSRRQLCIEIFFKGKLWGNVSVGQCVFLLLGLSSNDITLRSDINFIHSADSVKDVLIRDLDGEVISMAFIEVTMKIIMKP